MHSTRGSEKSLVIKQDDKFFSRLLSRDLSMTRTNKNGSFRGLPSSVPFTWESQPGTPKHQFYSSASQLLLPPPLTPPPSYYSAHSHNQIKIVRQTSSKSTGLFNKLNFFKWRVNNAIVSAQPSSPSIISSYSYSSSPSSFACSSTTTRSSSRTRIRFGSWGGSSSSNSSKADHEEDSAVSPSSTLCFMTRRKKISRNAVWDLQKKELMSVHGSN